MCMLHACMHVTCMYIRVTYILKAYMHVYIYPVKYTCMLHVHLMDMHVTCTSF